MKFSIVLYFNLFCLITFNSCWKSAETINAERIAEVELENEKAIKILDLKYNCTENWDSLSNYTYILQELCMSSNNLINFNGEIKDIIKRDSIYLIKIYKSSQNLFREYIAIITIDNEQFRRIKNGILKNIDLASGDFILRVSEVTPITPSIQSNYAEYPFPGAFIEFDFDETLIIIKGELVDFYVNKT